MNVLRNVARQNAPTHYILASDAELYPSPNLVGDFFAMLRRNESILHLGRPKIFVLPIFEVYSNQTVPISKAELVNFASTLLGLFKWNSCLIHRKLLLTRENGRASRFHRPKVTLFSGVFRFILYQSTALDVLYIFGCASRMIGSGVWLQIVDNGRRERALPTDSICLESCLQSNGSSDPNVFKRSKIEHWKSYRLMYKQMKMAFK